MAERTCSVEGCDRGGLLSRGWCKPHYDRWRRWGDPLYFPPPFVPPPCPVVTDGERCPKPVAPGDHMCRMHTARVQRHGDPHAVHTHDPKPQCSQRREDHPQWKAEEIGYKAAHDRVLSLYGKAAKYRCVCGCGRQSREWAYYHRGPDERTDALGTYSPDPTRYVAMCARSHRRMDAARRRAAV